MITHKIMRHSRHTIVLKNFCIFSGVGICCEASKHPADYVLFKLILKLSEVFEIMLSTKLFARCKTFAAQNGEFERFWWVLRDSYYMLCSCQCQGSGGGWGGGKEAGHKIDRFGPGVGHLNYLAVPEVGILEFLFVPVTTNHFPCWGHRAK